MIAKTRLSSTQISFDRHLPRSPITSCSVCYTSHFLRLSYCFRRQKPIQKLSRFAPKRDHRSVSCPNKQRRTPIFSYFDRIRLISHADFPISTPENPRNQADFSPHRTRRTGRGLYALHFPDDKCVGRTKRRAHGARTSEPEGVEGRRDGGVAEKVLRGGQKDGATPTN